MTSLHGRWAPGPSIRTARPQMSATDGGLAFGKDPSKNRGVHIPIESTKAFIESTWMNCVYAARGLSWFISESLEDSDHNP